MAGTRFPRGSARKRRESQRLDPPAGDAPQPPGALPTEQEGRLGPRRPCGAKFNRRSAVGPYEMTERISRGRGGQPTNSRGSRAPPSRGRPIRWFRRGPRTDRRGPSWQYSPATGPRQLRQRRMVERHGPASTEVRHHGFRVCDGARGTGRSPLAWGGFVIRSGVSPTSATVEIRCWRLLVPSEGRLFRTPVTCPDSCWGAGANRRGVLALGRSVVP